MRSETGFFWTTYLGSTKKLDVMQLEEGCKHQADNFSMELPKSQTPGFM